MVAALGPGAAHAAPEASITPSSFDFGPLRVESADTLARSTTFVIANTGDEDLVIGNNGITITGTNTGDFTITEKPSGNTTIPPGGMASIDVVVAFDPTAAGARSATLQVVSNAPAAATATLAGTGTSAVLSVTDVDFGLVNPNSSSTKDITLSNVVATDPGLLHVATATLAGGDGWFSFEGPICQGDVCDLHIDLPPDALLGVTCRPPVGATGVRTATVTFASDTDDPTDSVSALSCDAGAPNIDVVTPSVAFGDVPINPATPPERTVTIGNTGSQTLRFTASAPSPLYTLGGCATNCPVPSGETRDFTVTFNPTAPTIPDANIDLTITSNDPDGPVTIPVTGRGIAGILEVTVPPSGGDTIAFGGVARGTVATQDFTLTNTGNVDVVNIAAATPVPPDAGYSIDPMGPPVPATLGPGASVTLRARFAPDATADGGDASIAFSGTWGAAMPTSDELKLTGDGLNIGFSLEPDTIAFGNLRFDTTPERTFCVVNNGETTLQIQSPISIVPDMTTMSDELVVVRVRRPATCGGTSTMDVTLPQALAPGELLEVTVRADPANRTGAMGATLTVMSDLPVSPSRTLALSGTSTSGTLTITPGATLDFGPVDVLAPAAAQMITITNTGDGPLDLGSFTLAPDPAPAAFTIAPPGDTTLEPGGSLSIPVTYKPTLVAAEAVTLSHSVAGAINTPAANMLMIRGRGIDREIEVTTPLFPDTFRNPGDQAPVRPAKITNLGEAPLKVSGVMVTNDRDVWQLLDPSPVVIPAGASHDLLVRFAPKTSGRAAAELLIVNDDRDEMLVKIELVANVIDRSVRFGPDEIQLGYTGVGVPVRIEDALVVTSTDKDRMYQIQKIEIDSGSPFTIEGLSPNLDLAPLAERRFAVTFTPRSQGPFTAQVRLFLDMDPEAQHQVTLKGTAVFVDAHGGGGCATGSTGGAAGTAALALAALLGLRRR
ncbi:MAG TPA: choice-of-anchor D domain-containing protein, partial [Kofleriaceae bacterium]|nr:choice-of-anchor D domain-containing protein [Kofleriaceae bacterium]